MRTQFGLCAVALALPVIVSSLVFALPPGGYAEESLKRSDESGLSEPILTSIRHRLREIGVKESAREDRLVRITHEPFEVAPRVAVLCRSPFQQNPHEGKWVHVFVTSRGYDALKTGKGTYPQDTVILKEKFADAAGTKPLLFTGMLKREKGYNTKVGDWQFFVLNANATTVDTGNTHSCVQCHVPFGKTDFVARSYLSAAVVKGR